MLTERRIRDAKPKAKPYLLWDGTVKCLGLKVNPGGRKRFVISYWFNGRKRRASIGVPGDLTLADARRRAAKMLDGARHDGIDPLEQIKARREAPTVTQALDRYFDEHIPRRVENGRMSPGTVTHYRSWSKHLYHSLGSHKVAEVQRTHVERMVDGLQRTSRNRVLSLTRAVFNVFELWELRPRHSNPVYGIERSAESPRDRVLSDTELKALSEALAAAEDTYPAARSQEFPEVRGLALHTSVPSPATFLARPFLCRYRAHGCETSGRSVFRGSLYPFETTRFRKTGTAPQSSLKEALVRYFSQSAES